MLKLTRQLKHEYSYNYKLNQHVKVNSIINFKNTCDVRSDKTALKHEYSYHQEQKYL